MDLKKFDKFMVEAKKKPIPKVKGKGKYNFGIKYDPEGWYQKPEMMGHRWARESLDSLEAVMNTYSKSKLQKYVLDNVFGTPAKISKEKNDWHYFANHITKKDIANLQFVLRRIDSSIKGGMYSLLRSIEKKSSMLKSRLNWVLEVLEYKHDYEVYLKNYIAQYGLLGLAHEEAKERFERYHKGIKKKVDGQSQGL